MFRYFSKNQIEASIRIYGDRSVHAVFLVASAGQLESKDCRLAGELVVRRTVDDCRQGMPDLGDLASKMAKFQGHFVSARNDVSFFL